MAKIDTLNESPKQKIVRLIEGSPIGLQITFEREDESHEPVPTGLVMYNYMTNIFMEMTHKMHGPFFRAMIETEKQAILAEDMSKIAEHYAIHMGREMTGVY